MLSYFRSICGPAFRPPPFFRVLILSGAPPAPPASSGREREPGAAGGAGGEGTEGPRAGPRAGPRVRHEGHGTVSCPSGRGPPCPFPGRRTCQALAARACPDAGGERVPFFFFSPSPYRMGIFWKKKKGIVGSTRARVFFSKKVFFFPAWTSLESKEDFFGLQRSLLWSLKFFEKTSLGCNDPGGTIILVR